jgi:hypothetical protein
MVGLRQQDRKLVKQIDLVEEQHTLLCKEYAELKTAFEKLRFKRVQLQKQIDNLMGVIEENQSGGK